MDARMLYLQALSPVHTGTGQAVDVIDLPVARETATGWPYIPGSSIKGVLRALCDPGEGAPEAERLLFETAFGPPTGRADEGAGSLLFGDARLLCLPVRSLYGTFAWVTCSLALDRYRRDHVATGLVAPALPAAAPQDEEIIVTGAASRVARDGKVYLEDLDLDVRTGTVEDVAAALAEVIFAEQVWRDHFTGRFGVLSDTTFTFLAETGTEVTARIQLAEETKTVKKGALWYEEAIPAETILSAPLLAVPRGGGASADLFELIARHLEGAVQIGGHGTVGRGLMQVRLGEARS